MKPDRPTDPKVFMLKVDKDGRGWIYPVDVPNSGDYIHVTAFPDWNKTGEGYGGSTLKFTLDTGEEFLLRGGWHSNSNSLLNATGVDLTQRHYTHIGVLVEYQDGRKVEHVYDRGGWCLGTFERKDDIEWIRDNVLPLDNVKSLRVTTDSLGGSSSFWMVK